MICGAITMFDERKRFESHIQRLQFEHHHGQDEGRGRSFAEQEQ